MDKFITKENIDEIITEFEQGYHGYQPQRNLREKVYRVLYAAHACLELHDGDICVDDVGEINFNLELKNGMNLMAEISLKTENIYTTVFENNNPRIILMPCDEDTMIELFKNPTQTILRYEFENVTK